ncbi:MAG TPA: BadF/BadG/BcrA/BcrD ATPase family protein, partial [Rhodothermales bacterium]|nr:BadF/BadG/BcrA/BcrD ATPase family protein [Rhodothermales bacterium]
MTPYVLGIDGGGTKTLAAIVDTEGRLHGLGRGGPSNIDDVGVETARRHVATAVAQARLEGGLREENFGAVFLGMAGVVSEKDRTAILDLVAPLELAPQGCIGVDHDCRTALAGGLTGRPGLVLIVGTGSACYGRNAAGEDWRAGGWGHLISDEGGSYWLGVEALKAAVRVWDGRAPATLLTDAVASHLGLVAPDDLLHRLYVVGHSRAEIAALAPLVTDAACAGDAVAQRLIAEGAAELARCVEAVAVRLGLEEAELALVGGLLQAGEVFKSPLVSAIAAHLP